MGKKLSTEGLINRVKKHGPLYFTKFSPVSQAVSKEQLDFSFDEKDFDEDDLPGAANLRYFYEMVTIGLHGGKLSYCVLTDGKNKVEFVKPVVVDELNKRVFDVQADHLDGKVPLDSEQIKRGQSLKNLRKGLEISFVFYKYNIRNPQCFADAESRLFEELSQNTLAAFVLPLNVVSELYNQKGKSLSPRIFSDFFTRPISALADLGLAPRTCVSSPNYGIERLVSPKGFLVEGKSIRQFPILKISDKKADSDKKAVIDYSI